MQFSDADHPLLRHAAHEIPKAFPSLGIIVVSGILGLPWQQIGYMCGAILIVLQGAYSIWKWRREAKADRRPQIHVPPPADE